MQSRISFKPSRITLGSAQLGMNYGVANTSGQPNENEAFAILDRAVELGIETIDTARSYGTAEQVIGKWLASRKPTRTRVLTKVSKIPAGAGEQRKFFVREQIAASKAALGIERLALVLAHDESDLLDPAIVEEFQAALASGSIEGFGASVYDVAIAERLIATVPIAALEIPANIADRRFEQAGIADAASKLGIAVFARSVFLQGLLLMSPERLPRHLKAFGPFLLELADAARRSRRPIGELLIAAVRDMRGVTSLVIGVDTVDQLAPHVKSLSAPALPRVVRNRLVRAASQLPQQILLPSNWKRLGAGDSCCPWYTDRNRSSATVIDGDTG